MFTVEGLLPLRLLIAYLPTFFQIGEHLIVDPTVEEEACSSGSVVVSITRRGLLTGIFKIGEGSFHQKAICEAVKVRFSNSDNE